MSDKASELAAEWCGNRVLRPKMAADIREAIREAHAAGFREGLEAAAIEVMRPGVRGYPAETAERIRALTPPKPEKST